ncbi:MAG: response regulator [Lachnospiraceae bacterium]|nr:response regulator [Lachnospiraceae bacterium]
MVNKTKKVEKTDRDKSMFPIFAAVSVSFLMAIIVSIYSLAKLARENTKEIDTMLTYRIYDSIANSLNEPIVVGRTMACDDFLADFLENEDVIEENEAVAIMQKYLSSLKDGLEYDSAFLVSAKSRRYYTYEGLNKIVDPKNDPHDIWYSLFLEKNKPYDLDVDSDEMNRGQWTVFVNARIEDNDGELLGVCGVGVQMTNLQELFLTSEQEYGVKINLVDRNGLVQVDTEDINIENAWLDENVLSKKETDEYTYQTTGNDEFTVTKYVEYLGWYLVVRSAPTAINREFINIIFLNVVLFLLVMVILISTVAAILIRSKRERDDRERLLIVSERAVAASEAKSSFLSSMSHEIRTPINAVLGMNEMILRETDDEKILEHSSNIRNAGRTLLSLINSILDFSKIEEGKMEIVPVVYDTASMINNLVVSVAERAKDKGLDFSVDVDEALPAKMEGDDVRIAQVIMNLLTNAVKYTESGFVRFTIRKQRQEGNAVWLYVSVEDSGIGIRKEDTQRLFASFERLDEVKNHSIEGTGLGMSIVTNLLKLMDSEIRVESEYGVGSTFSFLIQQKISDETPIGNYSRRLAQSRKKNRAESLRAPHARVLVVDDNEMNLKVAENLLGLFGIQAQTSRSGFDAIERLKAEHYHVILLDHMMPKMDGIETLRKLKQEQLLSDDTKVVALTANAVNDAKERYLSAGFDDYLSKPMEVRQLEEILKKWLPKDIAEREAAKDEAGEKAREIAAAPEETAEDRVWEFAPDPEETAEDKILEFAPASDEMDGIIDSVYPALRDEIMINRLNEWGINTNKALRFCGGNIAFYMDVLSDYAAICPRKHAELDICYEEGDWHGFEINIHSLKSSSKTIGAFGLSEKALSLEKAAKNGKADLIKNLYPGFVSDYLELVEKIQEALESA